MRKLLFTAAMLLVCQFVAAQTVERIIEKFKNEDNVTCVNLPKSLIGIAKVAVDDEKTAQILEKIDAIRLIVIDEVSGSTRRKFNKEVKKLDFSGYDEMLRTKDDGETVKIMSKLGDGENISDLIVLTDERDECVLIHIEGSISPEDVQALVDKGIKMAKKHTKD